MTGVDGGQDRRGWEADSPRRIPLRGWLSTGLRIYRRIGEERLWIEAAGVAFFGLMSLFPALVVAVTAYGLVTDAHLVGQHLALAQGLLPQDAYDLLERRATTLAEQSGTSLGLGLLISLAIAFWGASRGINTLILVISHAYRAQDRRGFILRTALSFAFTLAAAGIFLLAVLALAGLPILLRALVVEVDHLQVVLLRWPILAGAIFLSLLFLYRFAPHRRRARWRWIIPGAVAACLGWLAFSFGFSTFVALSPNFGQEFGSLAAVIALMLWIYYSVMVIIVGALLNAELEHQTGRDTTIGPARPMGERGAYVADNSAGSQR